LSQPGIPEWVNQSLVFWLRDDPSRCFFEGNSHTYPGRMSAYHEVTGRVFSVSKLEIERPSEEARAWMDGFLVGSEPAPPSTDDPSDFDEWKLLVQSFRETGWLPKGSW
jgi:hypothetical protein